MGAFGRVFECRREGSSDIFAVKTISLRGLRLSTNSERDLKKLQREADILKSLPPHPRVVRLVDALDDGSWFYLVLELVRGGDLFAALIGRPGPRPRLEPREVSFVLQQLVEGLVFLHGQGIVHRDLKLENVLVTSSRKEVALTFYSVKITDFGLSKSMGEGMSEPTSMVGTKRYIAPEVMSVGSYDFRVDLWSLGILLYLLLEGRYPHDLPAHATQEALDGAVSRLASVVSAAPRAVVAGLLRLDPKRRLSLSELLQSEWLAAGVDSDAVSHVEVRHLDEEDDVQIIHADLLLGSTVTSSAPGSPPPIAPGAPAPSLSFATSVESVACESADAMALRPHMPAFSMLSMSPSMLTQSLAQPTVSTTLSQNTPVAQNPQFLQVGTGITSMTVSALVSTRESAEASSPGVEVVSSNARKRKPQSTAADSWVDLTQSESQARERTMSKQTRT